MKIAKYKREFELAKLIAKSRLSVISQEEQKTLDALLAEAAKDNKKLQPFNVSKFRERQDLASSIDTYTPYRRVLKRIKTYEHPKTSVFNRYYKYAAILILAIGIGSGIFVVTRTQSDLSQNPVTDLAPGSQKAILILGNGDQVTLGNTQNVLIEKDSSIVNLNNTLVYSTGKNNSVESYNTLLVPIRGVYNLSLADGTRVWLNSESSLYYPVSFNGNTRKVVLKGEAYFEVAKNREKPFIVSTAFTDINVVGTKFNVSAYAEDSYNTVTLNEGKVQLSNTEGYAGDAPVVLNPGEQATLYKDTNQLEVSDVNTAIASAWKDGKFYFDKAPLDQILTRMARWYDFEFSFQDRDLHKVRFTGVIDKNKTLTELLNILKTTSNINYRLTQKSTDHYELSITKK